MFDIGFLGSRIRLTTVLVNKLFSRVDSVTHVKKYIYDSCGTFQKIIGFSHIWYHFSNMKDTLEKRFEWNRKDKNRQKIRIDK